ncbi:MAG TPA: copper resistance CopC family protein [Pedococcus sp.]|nr:copper resistance CopC family protein [Pedococcus sp.]
MDSEGKRRVIRIAVWVAVLSMLLAVFSSLATALAASAHAALTSMTPAAGSTVTVSPPAVVLKFSEPVSSSFAVVTVTDRAGASVVAGRPAVDGSRVTQPLRRLGSGTYSVSFRVVSADGHPVSDTAAFTIRPSPSASPSSAAPSGSSAGPLGTTQPPSGASSAAPAVTPPHSGDAASGPSPALLWTLTAAVALALFAGAVMLNRRRSGPE